MHLQDPIRFGTLEWARKNSRYTWLAHRPIVDSREPIREKTGESAWKRGITLYPRTKKPS